MDSRPLLAAAASVFRRPDIAYILTHGRQGTAPAVTSVALRDSGVFIMRDSWAADANYAAIDAGPFGSSYQHEDKLGLELAAFGRTVLVDPGRYLLSSSDPIVHYLSTTRAHSTVMIDDSGQERVRRAESRVPSGNSPNAWVSTDAFDYFAGGYVEGYARARGVRHFRRILFVKDGRQPYWVISDRVLGEGSHTISARWQFVPGALDRREPLAFATQAPRGNLAVCPPEQAAGEWTAEVLTGSREPMGGWVSPAYGKIEAAPQLIYDWPTSLPATLTYVLVPSRGAAALPKVREETAGKAAGDITRLAIDFGEFRDRVLIDHDLAGADREVAGLSAKGCFVVVRTGKEGKGNLLLAADAGDVRPPTAE
jgi:hypothetical protein